MKKIGVAGLQREHIKKTIETSAPGCFEVFIYNDMEAAMKVKSGLLDYYIGACNTGAGAALSIAIAIIGFNKVAPLQTRREGERRAHSQNGRWEKWLLAYLLSMLNMRSQC
jgi:hypothetical protein